MAREKKQRRGRRGTKKVKPSVEEAGRPVEDEDHSDDEQVEEPDVEAEVDAAPGPVEPASLPGQPFYGLVPTDIRQYAMNVETMLEEQSFEDAEEQSLFLSNVYQSLEDNELRLATDYDCSRILEKLLRLSDDFQLRVFMDRITGRFADVFRHQYASHVCQTLLEAAADVVDREVRGVSKGSDTTTEDKDKGVLLPMQDLIVDMCSEIQPQVKVLAADVYGSHIIRLLLGLLVGDRPSEQTSVVRSKRSKSFAARHHQPQQTFQKLAPRQVPDSFKSAANGIIAAIFQDLDFDALARFALNPLTSPVLQQVLSVASKLATDETSDLSSRILGFDGKDSSERSPFVEKLLRDPVGSHLLQKVVQQLDGPSFHRLYLIYFRKRLEELSSHPLANFVVQELIAGVRTKVELDMILEELGPTWAKLLFGTRAGVVVKTLEACLRLRAGYQEAAKWLQEAFDYGAPDAKKHVVGALLAMQKFDEGRPPTDPGMTNNFSLHGSLLMQHMFSFPAEASRLVVQSFLELPTETLLHLALNHVGCRVIEAFISSPEIGLKAKKKLLRSFSKHFADLAMDKYGSHIVDKLWSQVADIGDKERVAEELLESLAALQNSHHGKFIVRNCRLENFKREKDSWREKEAGIDRRKEMFKDILAPEGAPIEGSKTGASKVPLDPLIESKAYDKTMHVLGFGDTEAHGKASDGKKGKKAKDKKKNGAKDGGDAGEVVAMSLGSLVPSDTAVVSAVTVKDDGLDFVLEAVRSSGKKRKSGAGEPEGKSDKKKAKKFMS